MSIKIILDELRQKLKFVDVYKLSRDSGVSVKSIYNIINGKHTPTLKTIERLLLWIK